jgi:hypothetical protein
MDESVLDTVDLLGLEWQRAGQTHPIDILAFTISISANVVQKTPQQTDSGQALEAFPCQAIPGIPLVNKGPSGSHEWPPAHHDKKKAPRSMTEAPGVPKNGTYRASGKRRSTT